MDYTLADKNWSWHYVWLGTMDQMVSLCAVLYCSMFYDYPFRHDHFSVLAERVFALMSSVMSYLRISAKPLL